MARRRPPRRRPVEPPADSEPSSVEELPWWVRRRIARGKLTAEGYLEHRRELRQKRLAALVRRVPPVVRDRGPAAVTTWAQSMIERDPRVELAEDAGHLRRDPLAPIPHADVVGD